MLFEAFPKAGEAVFASSGIIPVSDQTVPFAGGTVSIVGRAVREADETVP
jgi:hypothetical protein